jgi:predicted nucleic acid-binding protein
MRLVVADTGPLNYLVLIEAIELLPNLFEKVFAPEAVRAELLDQDAPAVVRAWAAQPPGRFDVRSVSSATDDPAWRKLDIGEREALALARTLAPPTWFSWTIALASPSHANWVWRRPALWVFWTSARGVG